MKKSIIWLLALATILLSSCGNSSNGEYKNGNYVWSNYKWNYVWWCAMNLAWNDLNENILHDKLQLNTTDKTTLDLVEKFNNPPVWKNDLDEQSYYIKSGYWQETVSTINRESKAKFPNKSSSDLDISLGPLGFIAYAYFFKQVEYKDVFDENNNISFSGTEVKWFKAWNQEQKNNIKILKYENDDKFIIKITLKDDSDELILAKWYDMQKPEEVVKEINNTNWIWLSSLWEYDYFEAPLISLDYHRDYNELTNKKLSNKWFKEYQINQMFEKIKFKMDKTGAKVENEAIMSFSVWALPNTEEIQKIRYFFLDKPYWIVMKKSDSSNPYFILGITNAELMEKAIPTD